ncbi:MAG: sigma 54-interacting transcriptional regulator [bacterium]|nr:MAG: sigma 54-interacting transcriptional regulator [bacterium]
MSLTRKISGDGTGSVESPTLLVREGPDKGAARQIEGTLTIGSRPESGLCLSDPTVSRRHAEVSRTAQGFLLQDLGSTNGTYLNGVRVDRAYLRDGAVLTMGKTSMVFVPGQGGELRREGAPSAFGEMVARSEPMKRAFALLEGLAASDVTVLIEGETGTGKELAARALHERSPRTARPFIIFDCSTVPAELMESELFGYARGAFTGATDSRPGAIGEAEGGTLFLDEIGELPLNLQPKLLRLLDRREYRRLGTAELKKSNVRFVAATNRDLGSLVREDRFRRDLFFRVSAARVELPSLRERPEDIEFLARHFLEELSRGRGGLALEDGALKALKGHSWPGNVRELRNVLETAAALNRSGSIGAADLPVFVAGQERPAEGSLRDAEAAAIADALRKAGGNKRKAARLLGIAPSTLYAKMKRFGID